MKAFFASLPLFFPGANPCTLRGNVTYEGGFLDGVGVRQGGGGRFYKENDRATYICENGYSRAVLGKVTCTYNRTKGEFFWKPTPVCRHDALQAGTVEVITFVEQSSFVHDLIAQTSTCLCSSNTSFPKLGWCWSMFCVPLCTRQWNKDQPN